MLFHIRNKKSHFKCQSDRCGTASFTQVSQATRPSTSREQKLPSENQTDRCTLQLAGLGIPENVTTQEVYT